MLGNLIKESGVTDRMFHSLQGDVLNLLTMLIGLSIGAAATADRVLPPIPSVRPYWQVF
ncbi:MAG: sodium ion-translocating decarboxylase subunit beta [Spirochaetaceae bacterium]|nr:sodium ion-translocating decarboxylase subunit beta [Spirochaetaceae bacterium]